MHQQLHRTEVIRSWPPAVLGFLCKQSGSNPHPVLSVCALQLTVRVTWDRGDVEHFIAEAVRLNDGGAANYQTIVAGAHATGPHQLIIQADRRHLTASWQCQQQ